MKERRPQNETDVLAAAVLFSFDIFQTFFQYYNGNTKKSIAKKEKNMSYEIMPEHLSAYLVQLRDEEKSPHTIEKYLRDVKSFCSFTGGLFPGKETVIT